ncbi:uncharacterized protein LOC108028001 [Drosophila biarmipes]|uniref:uncharacterized protein LOC108028001 n=1 Tax=Drosophila biarmipes TaxID=125945 RepID=UPI0007E7BCD1|nr:uncharacterized protein LOC108028001 [Drosophila biarmipes]XP_050742267.1 uncharacterized protein LOC108028001 [Drosophila biarmipes]
MSTTRAESFPPKAEPSSGVPVPTVSDIEMEDPDSNEGNKALPEMAINTNTDAKPASKSDARSVAKSASKASSRSSPEPEQHVPERRERRRKSKERPAPPTAPPQKLNWKFNLRILISNLYMKSEDRLPGACVPKCLHNATQCTERHRCSMLPDAPNFTAVQALRTTLHGQHYDTFLDILEMMVLQCVYPGEGVLDRLIDMAMILIAKEMSVKELGDTYNKLIRTFFLLVDAFPPCWTALRPYYLNFLGVRNPALRDVRSKDSPQKLQFYLNLLEETLAQCTDEEIQENTKFYEKFVFNFSEEEDANMSQETVFLRHVQEYDWLSGKLCLDDFNRMSPAVRLARVCDVLNMLTWVLEMEFLSWLDHNRLRQSESEMFQEDSQPFAAIVFGMSASTRLTDIVKQVMKLYGQAAAKSMYPERQRILQRLISLVIEVSNTAELKYVDNAVIYPNLGVQTRQLIADFFNIFKSQNAKHIDTYLKTIPQLDLTYLRYEFTDHFLQLFHFPKKLPFGPEKVVKEFTDCHWLNYKPKSEIGNNSDTQLCREDYLGLLLNALKDFDKWLNLGGFWKFLKRKEHVQPLTTRTSSPLATPVGVRTGDTGVVFMLDEMDEEKLTWKKRMNEKVVKGRPKVNLPVARINVAKMCVRYGEDVRQLRFLRRLLQSQDQKEVDVSDWLIYLNSFLGDDEPISQPDCASASASTASSDD